MNNDETSVHWEFDSMYGCSFSELSELSYTIPKKVINRQLLNAIAFVARTPTSPGWNFKAFCCGICRWDSDDGPTGCVLQLFIFSFAHKLWVKCIEYSSFVFFCFANIVLYLLLLSIMMFPNIVIPIPHHSPHNPWPHPELFQHWRFLKSWVPYHGTGRSRRCCPARW